MAKLTLLEIVQNVLSALDEEPVSNIDDTPSAAQVAEVAKEVYYQLIANENVPELQKLFKLSAAPSGENALLTLPTTIDTTFWIKYNKIKSGATRADYRPVTYMEPEEFLTMTDGRDSTASNIEAMTDPTSASVTIYIYNDTAPTYWTSFDDTYVVFDSYDSAVDASGIDESKTKCWGQSVPTWTASNSFTPSLDGNVFPHYLAEVKAVCFANLKELSPKTEKTSRQTKSKQQSYRYKYTRPEYEVHGPNYGRK